MPIQVSCPGCHKRFSVNEKFAGKKGPCPKCKAEITIPTSNEEVVVHAPESFGPKGTAGQAVLKPVFREYAKFSPVITAGAVMGIVCVFLVALMVRLQADDENFPIPLLVLGALLIAPPVVWGGYSFLHDSELEPHKGKSLWIRVTICSAVYALIWGLIWFIDFYAFESEGFPMPMLTIFVPLMVMAGAGAAFASLDLEFFMGLFHYGLYLLVTVLLRVTAGIPAFPLTE